MLSVVPWVLPLGILVISLFAIVFITQLGKKIDIDQGMLDVFVMISAAVVLMSLGSLVTIWLL